MNSTKLLNRSKRNAKPWQMRLTLALMSITTFCIVNGGCSARREIVFVNDSERVTILDVNEPAPFRGVLITIGKYEQFLDYEGMAQ